MENLTVEMNEKWLTKMKRLVASFNLIKVDFNYLHILWLYWCISYTCVQHPTIRNDDQWTTRALIIQRTVRLLLQVNVDTNVRWLGGHGHLRLNKSPGGLYTRKCIGNYMYMYLTFIVKIFRIVFYLIIIIIYMQIKKSNLKPEGILKA